MRSHPRGSAPGSVLVPFWSPYPQAAFSREPDMPSDVCDAASMPWRGDQRGTNKNPSSDMTKPR